MINSLNGWLSSVLPVGADKALMTLGGTMGGVLSFAFGDIGVLLWWLLAMAGLDLLTGTAGAMRERRFKSHDFFVGISKKVLMFVFVALAHGVDQALDHLFHYQVFQSIVICAYALCEFGSIIENLEGCGLGGVVPPVIKRALAAFNERMDSTVDKLADKDGNGKEDVGK